MNAAAKKPNGHKHAKRRRSYVIQTRIHDQWRDLLERSSYESAELLVRHMCEHEGWHAEEIRIVLRIEEIVREGC